MAEFLRTSGISYKIEDIIINANEKLYIESPYLKLSENLFERLKEKEADSTEIIFIYGKSELNEFEKVKLNSLSCLTLYFYKNLHAKCYFNENEMLITSMNLHEYSEKNNREMGIFITKDDDSKMFDDAVREVMSIISAAKIEKKANLEALASNNVITIDYPGALVYNESLNVEAWCKQLFAMFQEQNPNLSFGMGWGRGVTCDGFHSQNLSFTIKAHEQAVFVEFKFYGKNRKDVFYNVKSRIEESLEKCLPNISIHWGNQMMRIEFRNLQNDFPDLLNFDQNTLLYVYKLIKIGEREIIPALKNFGYFMDVPQSI